MVDMDIIHHIPVSGEWEMGCIVVLGRGCMDLLCMEEWDMVGILDMEGMVDMEDLGVMVAWEIQMIRIV